MSSDSANYEAGTALSQARYLIMMQLGCSIGTYVINSWIARITGPEVIGVTFIEFQLVYSAVMFLSREYIRRACVNFHKNETRSQRDCERQVFSVGWYSVLVSVILAFVIDALLQYQGVSSNLVDTGTYMFCIRLCTCAGIIEMLGEPYQLVATMRVLEKQRAAFESFNLILRSLFAFAAMKWIDSYRITYESEPNFETVLRPMLMRWQMVAMAGSQVAASGLVTYAWIFSFLAGVLEKRHHAHSSDENGVDLSVKNGNKTDTKQKKQEKEEKAYLTQFCDFVPLFLFHIDAELRGMLMSYFSQSFLKFMLQEGEKVIMIGLKMDATVKGVYALVSNLGSLVARYTFAPLEKACYIEFAKSNESNKVGQILTIVLKTVILLSVICIVFSPHYAYMVLNVIYGAKWSDTDAPTVLARYCIYLLLMAMNGVTESYVMSRIGKSEVNNGILSYNVWLVIFGFVYYLACFVIIGNAWFGATGVIAAHCINMTCRVVYNVWFASKNLHVTSKDAGKKVKLNGWQLMKREIRLNWMVAVMFAVCYVVGFFSERELVVPGACQAKLLCYAGHALVAVALLAVLAGLMWTYEKKFLRKLRGLLTGKMETKED